MADSGTLPNQSAIRVLFAGSIGNTVEWFDWTVYGTYAIFFSKQFFPGSATAALLSTLLTFALGFFARPIGGWLIGIYSDRHGRRAALVLTITMMAAGSLLIAVIPPYTAIGVFAPILLVLARLTQGISVGGEVASGSVFLAEMAPANRRGLYSSFFYFSLGIGLLIASGLGTILSSTLAESEMASWGWRVPFVVGAIGGLVGLWIRRGVGETEYFLKEKERVKRPLLTVVRNHPKAALRVIGFTIAATFSFYIFVTAMPTYAANATGMPKSTAFLANTIAVAVFTVILPFLGALSDRIGRKPMLLFYAIVFGVIMVPLMNSLSNSFGSVLLVNTVGMAIYAIPAALSCAIYSEQFPTRLRAVGIGPPYSLAVAVFGGTAPFLLEWLREQGQTQLFFWYVVAGCVVSAIAFATMREGAGRPLPD